MTAAGMIRGVVGQIRWSYYVAASVTNFTVTRHGSTTGATVRWTLRATLVLADAFKLSRKPLVFQVETKKGLMTWPITDLVITDRDVTATLGTPT